MTRLHLLRLFPLGAIAWFCGSAVVCAWFGEWRMAKFYGLSAAINWVMLPS